MDRNRDLANQLVNVQKRLDEQMDLDYARHGVTIVPEGKATSTAVTGSFYAVKADGLDDAGVIIASITVDGTVIATDLTLTAGDVFYGNITSILLATGGSGNAILLHKKGHGATFEVTVV